MSAPRDIADPKSARRDDRICLGQFAGAHGVRGAVRVRSFTADPMAIGDYGPLEDERRARHFVLTALRPDKAGVIAAVDGVGDRDAAQALAGTRLFVERAKLPAIEDTEEFYHADLIGARAETIDGAALGEVIALHDFGAGEMLEVRRPRGPSLMVPFTCDCVPVVDVPGARVVIDPPAGLIDHGPVLVKDPVGDVP